MEEYPSTDFCHVLNGKLFGMWGIWCYYSITKDDFALTLFKAAIESIVDHYPVWGADGQNVSRYCLHNPASEFYHEVQIFELRYYADFFNIPEFREAADCISGAPS
jgi:hypothetical protein